MIGGGALGQQAATTVRHVAAQNGVWSLGNFGGVPPKSAMMHHEAGTSPVPSDPGIDTAVQQPEQKPAQDGSVLPNRIEDPDYRFVFNSCTVGMVSCERSRVNVFPELALTIPFTFRLLRQWEGPSLIATSFFVS
jgi:hypothetical protein